ncbi:L-fuculose-phosphate aldolase [Anaerobacterium chartisolvens]|uniref:L-fuculose-phosphate aldolase n=1 Tax=Anaerobacterium chartisolvens TaxID=1297424 RepID=A0A369B586_9FIRM|nr:class II aldolase/adducin family protein [Anaerobacterium chartisolvens]RCX16601.1 L-fuculose-phosphate aldolase [Anaerobacterium chartisolvens]
MNFELLHPADQLVMIMERIYQYGMTTTSGGNLSILDDDGDIWITPGGIDKGTLTRKDIICVRPDGTMIGIHKPSMELPFHASVYRKRPDVRAIIHAHPPALVAFSIVRKIPNTRIVPDAHVVCGEVGMAEYDLPGSIKLGDKIAAVFEKGVNTVMMENHGVVVAHKDLFNAFKSFETLEFCARLEIEASKLGNIVALSDKHVEMARNKQQVKMDEFVPNLRTSKEKEARRQMCDLIHRAYDQTLFTSTQGTFSQRLEGDSFLITPYMKDRKYMEIEDVVRIDRGMCELGKTPSRSVMLHKIIYEQHPEINSVIIAHPPNIMAFAVTGEEFDSRTIPESYLLLRYVKKIAFGSSFMQPQMVSQVINDRTPVILVENDSVIATGTSLLNAFDRLEVAEYSAKALIASKSIGSIVAINDKQVKEIDTAFNLK